MKKLLLLSLLALATSCQTDADIRPANYDELAMATGHWEWDSSSFGFMYHTPASIGFTRQLVFGPDHSLVFRHGNLPAGRTDYQLSIATIASPAGGTVSHPAITFTTSEPGLANNSLKYYSISQQNGQQVLELIGDQAYRDAGGYELYHWVAD